MFDQSTNWTVQVYVYADGIILYAMFQEPKVLDGNLAKAVNATEMMQKAQNWIRESRHSTGTSPQRVQYTGRLGSHS
jgi:hypothetical protein